MITAQGIGSGLDVASIVAQLVAAEGQPAALRLSTREASIQSQLSALGSLKSALSEFKSALSPINDLESFRSRMASSSNEAAFTTSSNNSAVPSTYEIDVINLAEAHKLASGAFADSDTPIGFGELTFQFGSDPLNKFTIEIPEEEPLPIDADDPAPEATSTLAAIRDAINDAPGNDGVRASIVTAEDGAHLVLTATSTGLESELTITAEGGDGGLEAFEFGEAVVDSEMSELQEALDATITIDSFTRTSSSNLIVDAIDGVSINLQSGGLGAGQLTVAYDASVATEKVSAFVESYNTLVDAFAAFSSFDAETGTASTLLGDSTLREVSSALRREIGGGAVQGYGFYRTLSTVGITTETDGKLTFDQSIFTQNLDDDFDAVGRLFADEDTGFATRLDAVIEPFTQTGGRIDTRTDGLKESIDIILDQRERLDLRLASVEQRYLRQFSALDGIISNLSTTSSFLAAQLNSLPTANLNR